MARYFEGNANPKWFQSHAAELAHYRCTGEGSMSEEVQVTPELLESLEAYAKAAVAGPWHPSARDRVAGGVPSHLIARCDSGYEDRSVEYATAGYIALADPPTVLALVSRIRALEKEKEALRNETEEVWTPEGE
jgi:hypothetical protein